jgi:hypothetical protein
MSEEGPGQVSYLLSLGRFSEDKSKQTQADFLMLGGTFTYLEGEEGKKKKKTKN